MPNIRDTLRQPDNMTLPLPPATPVAFTTPRLKDRAAHGAARFVPEYSEVFASIFTWWNALDALMATTADIPWQTGYVREVQVRRMVALSAQPFEANHILRGRIEWRP